ncbi:MAG: OmpA family protein [Myxococcales bacterium]|nr:OmpA family protein [Myxococcales bacterium]
MARRIVLALLLAGCNAKLADGPVDGGALDATQQHMIDGGADARVLGMWSTPTPINGASDAVLNEDDVTLSSTQTELYFGIANATKDLYMMTRATPQAAWGPKQALPFNTTTAAEESPRLSPDDLTLYFGRGGDIYSATRTAVGMPWGAATLVPVISTANYEKWLAVCSGGYFMVSRANGANGQDLYQGQLGAGAGTLVTELNSTASEISTFLSNDCLTVYFASNRTAAASTQLYTATRTSVASPWSTPVMVTEFGMSADNEDPWMSADQTTFVFASVRPAGGTKDLFISTR